MLNQTTKTISSLSDTIILSTKLATIIQQNQLKLKIAFNGELGSGKTTFIRNMLVFFGVSGTIKSPTFAIVEDYNTAVGVIYHFDLYRFDDPEEWYYAGFDEYLASDVVCFIEWAENAETIIYPALDLIVDIKLYDDLREYIFTALSEKGNLCLSLLT